VACDWSAGKGFHHLRDDISPFVEIEHPGQEIPRRQKLSQGFSRLLKHSWSEVVDELGVTMHTCVRQNLPFMAGNETLHSVPAKADEHGDTVFLGCLCQSGDGVEVHVVDVWQIFICGIYIAEEQL